MRRFALTILVALLAFSASGVWSLFVEEPCAGYELAGGQDDGTCPPTCVTCGCCAQAAVAGILPVDRAPDLRIAEVVAPLPRLLEADPVGIFHVPKTLPA